MAYYDLMETGGVWSSKISTLFDLKRRSTANCDHKKIIVLLEIVILCPNKVAPLTVGGAEWMYIAKVHISRVRLESFECLKWLRC